MFKCITSTLIVCGLVIYAVYGNAQDINYQYQGQPQPPMVPIAPQQPMNLTNLPPAWQNGGIREQWTSTQTHDIKPIREYPHYPTQYYGPQYGQQQYYMQPPCQQYQYYYQPQTQYECYPRKETWIPWCFGGR